MSIEAKVAERLAAAKVSIMFKPRQSVRLGDYYGPAPRISVGEPEADEAPPPAA